MLKTRTYRPLLSDRGTRILQWRATALMDMGSRAVKDRSDRPRVVVFTDAATSTATIAAATIDYNARNH